MTCNFIKGHLCITNPSYNQRSIIPGFNYLNEKIIFDVSKYYIISCITYKINTLLIIFLWTHRKKTGISALPNCIHAISYSICGQMPMSLDDMPTIKVQKHNQERNCQQKRFLLFRFVFPPLGTAYLFFLIIYHFGIYTSNKKIHTEG